MKRFQILIPFRLFLFNFGWEDFAKVNNRLQAVTYTVPWSASCFCCTLWFSCKTSIWLLFVCRYSTTFWHCPKVVSLVFSSFVSSAVIFPCIIFVTHASWLRMCNSRLFKSIKWLLFVSGTLHSLVVSLKKSSNVFNRQLITTEAAILKH